MQAGRLRHKVTIEVATETRDAAGGVVRTFNSVGTRRADIRPLRGREFFEAKQVSADVTHKIIMRHHDSLVPDNRITEGGRVFQILGVINLSEMNRTTEVMAKEVV